jgi:hypothetical protein
VNRPSPPGDGGPDRDLLAHARDRLPPEVDVVALARPTFSEGDPMTPLAKAAVPLLAGAVALTGCSPSPDDIRSSAAKSRATVLDVSDEVLDEMTTLGQLFGPVEGQWRSCRDKAGWLQYYVEGRLDPAPDASADDVLVDRVTAALAPRGYRLATVDDDGEVLTLEAVTGEVNTQVTAYTSDPFVVFDISGGCVEVADLDGEFRYDPPEPLR